MRAGARRPLPSAPRTTRSPGFNQPHVELLSRLADLFCAALNVRSDLGSKRARKHSGDPHKASAIRILSRDLKRRVMPRDRHPCLNDGVSESTSVVVNIEDQLSDYRPIGELERSQIPINSRIGDPSRKETLVNRTHIA